MKLFFTTVNLFLAGCMLYSAVFYCNEAGKALDL